MSPDGGIKHPNVPAELFDRVKDVADGELPDAIEGRSLSFADALELVLDRAERGGRSSGGASRATDTLDPKSIGLGGASGKRRGR